MSLPLIFSVVFLCIISTLISKKPPNVIIILADDLGYDDLGYQSQCHQISTPNIDYFYKNGRELEWYYVQMVCSPSRSTLMTGRYPLHNSINKGIGGGWGVPLYLQFLPKILKTKLNYKTHGIGKWHLGYYKVEYTPTYRGFDTFYGFYGGCNNYYNHTAFTGFQNGTATYNHFDFRNDTEANCGYNCSLIASQHYGEYSTYLYADLIENIIKNHNNEQALFLYLAMQNVHYPCQCPQEYINEYNNTIYNTTRREFAGQLSILDEAVGNITNILRNYHYMDNNTMIVFSTDNGAPVHSAGCGGSNYPLRGEKGTVWEGGTRGTAAFWATDDLFDYNDTVRGTKYTQLMHIVDWYNTILYAAGIDIYNTSNGINITNLDSINHWNSLIGKYNGNDSYFAIRDNIYYGFEVQLKNVSFRKKWLKIFNGTGGSSKMSGWYPPPIGIHKNIYIGVSNYTPGHIPLYNLSNDPYEYYDINNSTEMNNVAINLWNEMVELQRTGIPNAVKDPTCPDPIYPYDPDVNMTVVSPYCNSSISITKN